MKSIKFNDMDSVNAKRISCCGVIEISGIQNNDEPEENLFAIYQALEEEEYVEDNHEKTFAYVLFTEHTCTKAGEKLAALIGNESFGQVVKTKKQINGNTNATLRAYIWIPNKAFLRWGYKTMRNQEKEEQETYNDCYY